MLPLIYAATEKEPSAYEKINKIVADAIGNAYGVSIAYTLIVVLLGFGIYATIRTGAVQFTMFGKMWKTVLGSRKGAEGGISSFQAFAVGLADRIGTGNIAGVAIAITVGGAGSIFWMWVVALIGMASAFIEATLAQLFKVRNPDGTFRGGPAFYIERGLGSRTWGSIFAVLLIFTYAFTFQLIQSNTLAGLAKANFGMPTYATGLLLVAITAPFFIMGIRSVARIAEYLAPLMALIYMVLALIVIVENIGQLGAVLTMIFQGAFGVNSMAGGALGGFYAALMNGTKRGLYSNEAGMGSAPNAAATATVSHPVKQGFIQSLGVFVDTIMVCTATAFIVLLGGVYDPNAAEQPSDGAALTVDSLASLGGWTKPVVLIVIFMFVYSTLLGNFSYAEGNIKYLLGIENKAGIVKAICIIAVFLGSVLSLKVVWNLGDWTAALMAIMNLVACFLLFKWALGALKDYKHQLETKPEAEIQFCSTDNEFMPGVLPTDIWTREGIESGRNISSDPNSWEHED
ncbi:alanine/glycine:cation symporter family protein [Mobiluncus porci]|uniref:Alanine:cation symporter family protein n=1 Tax=Mobiluncus porci TaxID=2652278 RepID=A0A7K0K3W0_9ACTO|nr:alanine/glycine:cation symporter family protein [Mobiluncus porci]MST50114.1 alanine:cation symporter family protein [Mobiluncus porci]